MITISKYPIYMFVKGEISGQSDAQVYNIIWGQQFRGIDGVYKHRVGST